MKINYQNSDSYVHILEITNDTYLYDNEIFYIHGFNSSVNAHLLLIDKLKNTFRKYILIDWPGNGGSDKKINFKIDNINEMSSFGISIFNQILTYYGYNDQSRMKDKGFYIFAHSLGANYALRFQIWNNINKQYNILHSFHISALCYTSVDKYIRDEKTKGCFNYYFKHLPFYFAQLLSYKLGYYVQILTRIEFTRKIIAQYWMEQYVCYADPGFRELYRQSFEHSMEHHCAMNVQLLNLVWHPLEVARDGLAELVEHNAPESNRTTVIYGDKDWMDRRGALELERQGLVSVHIVKDSQHHVHVDNSEQVKNIIINTLTKTSQKI
eukprot:Mrub_04796.p1 GENE.Mrub_04796~~Mrub_04796.p1  ORF type:complete len:363 (-),score=38.40 Mrub_04796:128-1102(-)